jgi:fumarate reductase (CoM/CoB) subunit A
MVAILETEVLVLGGGGAASRAAIEAHMAGAKVLLAVKGRYGLMGIRGGGASDGSALSRPDYAYFSYIDHLGERGWPGTEVEAGIAFTREVGLGAADPKLIKVLIENAVIAAENLDKWGVVLGNQWSKSAPRRVRPMPGLGNVVRGSGIKILEGIMLTSLLQYDGTCVGAVGIQEDTGEPIIIKAGAVILGTGGYAQLYLLNCHESGLTGDGVAMGYEAGAPVMNVEFMQIMPAIIYPATVLLGSRFWKMNLIFRNRNGEEFIEKYLPSGITLEQVFEERALHSPFSTRDRASRYIEVAMFKEFKAGRATEKNGFYIECEQPDKMAGYFSEWLRYRGIDWGARNQQCNAIFHVSNGGLKIDETGQTQIEGLYAIGETSAGSHGADRAGGHMMGASQVFGMLSGKHAAIHSRSRKLPPVNEKLAEGELKHIAALKASTGNQKPADLKARLKKVAYENMLMVRSEESLTKVINEVQSIREASHPHLSVKTPKELVEALELGHLLTVGEIIALAARMRKESRGSHFREDYPERDDLHWLGVITAQKVNGKPKLQRLVIDPEWTERPGGLSNESWG